MLKVVDMFYSIQGEGTQVGVPAIFIRLYGCAYRDWETDRKSTRLNSSHSGESRMPSSA